MPHRASGQTIAGYRIESFVGRGGMGEVYRATQLSLARPVALKLIVPELSQDEGFRERFRREARTAASLRHPNLLPVYEVGDADGQLFLSMALVEGRDLAALLRAEGPLEPRRAARIVARLGSALDAAHANGLVHRDVKPANVLLEDRDDEEQVYLTDFGLSKIATASSPGPTQTGQLVGTVDYISPEQISTGHVDARSDVYSLGCLLYECLTGEPPFPRPNDVAKLWAHVNEQPTPPSTLRSSVPDAFDAVLARALAKDPADRYPSAGDLGLAALAAAAGRSVDGPGRSVAQGEAAPGVAATRGPVPGRRRPSILAGVAALAVAGAVAGALAASGVFSADVEATEPTAAAPAFTPTPAGPAAQEPPAPPGAAASPTGAVSTPIQLAGMPSDIAIGPDAVWVTTQDGDLYEIDPVRHEVVGAPTRVGIVSGYLVGIEYDADRDVLWSLRADRGDNAALVRLDPETRQQIGPETPIEKGPIDMAIGEGALWVLVGGGRGDRDARSRLQRVDLDTAQVVGDPVVVGEPPGALAVGEGAVWIAENDHGRVVRFDPETNGVVGQPIPVDGFPGDVGAADTHVWFTRNGWESVGAIDSGANAVTGAYLGVEGAPTSISAAGSDVWVTGFLTDTVSWIDAALGQVVATIRVPPDPYPVVASADAVWVGSQKNETVVRLDPRAIDRAPARPGTPDRPGTLPYTGRLPAGTYAAPIFAVPFSFTVPAGWVLSLSENESSVSVVLDEPSLAGLNFTIVDRVFGEDGFDLRPVPDDLHAWFRGLPGVEVSAATPVSVGGAEGVQFDVELRTAPAEPSIDCGPTPCQLLFTFGERGVSTLVVDGRTRVLVLDVDGVQVVVTIDQQGRTGTSWEELLPKTEAVLDTVRFA